MNNVTENLPRCVVCQDDKVIDNGAGEYIPCEMCQFIHGLPRPVVVRFADDMEQRLQENDHKTGWHGESKQYMANILSKAASDLLLSLVSNAPVQYVTTRAADVANIAMMIADNEQTGAWPKVGQVIQNIGTGKFLKYTDEDCGDSDFHFVYVDRADQAEKYESLQHALYVAYWHSEIGQRYRVIDYDAGGVQYIVLHGNWVIEQPGMEADAVPADKSQVVKIVDCEGKLS